jgi:glyoxylase-like metal-dependent hydrolase (beta-lactamase superfamily II)
MYGIEKIVSPGQLEENCYLFWCEETKAAAIIDPGGGTEQINERVTALGLKVTCILLTHGHHDHIGSVPELRAKYGVRIGVAEADLEICQGSLPNFDGYYFLSDGQEVSVGSEKLLVLQTPGHTMGGLCFYREGVCFTGDTLFATDVGYTNLLGGGGDEMIANSIRSKLYTLPEDTLVYPGHDVSTSIGQEKWHNTVVRAQ